MPTFDGTDDYFDSRDLIERIAELRNSDEELSVDDAAELLNLDEFAEEASEDIPDWEDGELFVSDDYFETYAEDFARDIGAISDDDSWPLSYIDWERAADELKNDYTSFTLAGTTYWARA